jgi:hypothetical protein
MENDNSCDRERYMPFRFEMDVSEMKCVEKGTGTIWCSIESFNIINVGIHCYFLQTSSCFSVFYNNFPYFMNLLRK